MEHPSFLYEKIYNFAPLLLFTTGIKYLSELNRHLSQTILGKVNSKYMSGLIIAKNIT